MRRAAWRLRAALLRDARGRAATACSPPRDEPVRVMTLHEHDMVAERRAQELAHVPARERDVRLRAAEILVGAVRGDLALGDPEAVHRLPADAHERHRTERE